MSDVERGMLSKLEALASTPAGLAQVERIAQTSPSLEQRKLANMVLQDHQDEQRAAAQAEQSIAQDQPPRGLAALPAPSMDALSAASGGIIAFAGPEGSDVAYDPNKVYADPYQVLSDVAEAEKAKKRRELMGIGDVVTPEYKQYAESLKEGAPEYQRRLEGIEMMKTFAKMNRPGSTANAVIGGLGESGESIADMYNKIQQRQKDIATLGQDIYGKERTDKMGILTGVEKNQDEARKARLERDKAEIAHKEKPTIEDRLAQVYFNDLVANYGLDPKDPATRALAYKQAIYDRGLSGNKLNLKAEADINKAEKDSKELSSLRRTLREYEPGTPEHNDILNKIATEKEKIRTSVESKAPGRPEAPKPTDKVEGSGRNPLGTVNNPMPLPTSKEELKKDKVYQTARGPATWNGTDFVQK
jgi:hypothetical protein